jgi:hypothetical protein
MSTLAPDRGWPTIDHPAVHRLSVDTITFAEPGVDPRFVPATDVVSRADLVARCAYDERIRAAGDDTVILPLEPVGYTGHAKLFSQYATTPSRFSFWDKPESRYNRYGDHITIDHFFPPTVESPPTGTSSTAPPPAVVSRRKAKNSKNKRPTAPINPLSRLDTASPLIQDMLFVAAAAETRRRMYAATHYGRRRASARSTCNHTPHHAGPCTASITTVPDDHSMAIDSAPAAGPST